MPLRFAEPASQAYHYPLILRNLLESALATAGDQQIVYRDLVSISYRELGERIGRLAWLLDAHGVEPGATVAVMDWDSHRYLAAFFAVPMMGAVLQTVNVRLPQAQLAYTLEHARAEVLIVHQDFFSVVEVLLPSLPGIKTVIAIVEGADTPGWAVGEYEALLADVPAAFPFEDFDENAIATTFYTTGTTGNPKGVCFSHRQLVLQTLAYIAPTGAAKPDGFGHRDVYMPLTPMFHVHAWGLPYVATLLGLKQVYPGRYDPDVICKLRSDHRVTLSHCVPTVIRMILDTARRTGADLRGWTVTVGGSALSAQLAEEGAALGVNLVGGLGMSEAAPLIAKARGRFGAGQQGRDADLDSVLPAPLVMARIVDAEMRDVPHDGRARGELVLRSPWLTPCYTGDPQASEALWRGGWLHTQDIASMSPGGWVRLRDRMKDVIKTGGEWIDSIQLEELVAVADGVVEAAVIAAPDLKWGERPLAVLVMRPGTIPTLASINAPVEAAIATGAITRYARIVHIEIVDALPRTSVGKIDKKLLRASLAAE